MDEKANSNLTDDELLSLLALLFVPGVGNVTARSLLAYVGSFKEIFKQKKSGLEKIPGIGNKTADSILNKDYLLMAEKEIIFCREKSIQLIDFSSNLYPQRLSPYEDSPILIFKYGNGNLNASKTIAIVGTRSATEYGKSATQRIIEKLISYDVQIISGLAHGIDTEAHKSAVHYQLSTFGVLAHGLNKIYPPANRNLAKSMLENGGLITEFPSFMVPKGDMFPSRNRIIAGLSDAVLIVESSITGGSLITAEFAHSYQKDIFAVPGRINDPYSNGTNKLIKQNKASLIESGDDIAYWMNWSKTGKQAKIPIPKNADLLTGKQKEIYLLISQVDKIDIDSINEKSGLDTSETSMILLELEFSDYIQVLPGKNYKIKI